jgi:putative copper export protein
MKAALLLVAAFVLSAWAGGLIFLLWVTRKWEDTTRDVMP